MSKILIIDDSLFQRRVVSAPLKTSGFDVYEAVNGVEGLKKMEEIRPDLVLLDILMPEKDGIQVLKELQDAHNTIPVIMLTSDVQDSTREECISLGARAFLNKPVKSEELLPVITALISKQP